MTRNVLVLPGDGIGPEVTAEARRVIDWLNAHRDAGFAVTERPAGGACIDAHAVPITDETVALARDADAILFGAIGDDRWEHLPRENRPGQALLYLRKELDLFANLRPAILMPALADAFSLKRELVEGLDILIVRELTGGVYFGEPRGIETLADGNRRAVNTQVYSTPEIDRIARAAFDLARQRGGRVCSVDKANAMETGELWREVVQTVHDADFPDIDLSHMYADSCAMQLVRAPKQFDVIVTDNLFGDILSDCAAMLTGSLGMLPSASLGAPDASGRRPALYEPVHGSAPDTAGQGRANPLAAILSLAMALRYSFDMADDALLVENAVSAVLDDGLRTPDILEAGGTETTTAGMGDAVLAALDRSTG